MPPAAAKPVDRDAATAAQTHLGARDLAAPVARDATTERDASEDEGEGDEPRASEPRGWKGATIRGDGSRPSDAGEEPAARPGTLALGGVSVPPGAAVTPPAAPPENATPAPTTSTGGQPSWMIGLAIGLALGALVLLGLYLWHRQQVAEAPSPDATTGLASTAVVSDEPPNDPAAEPPRSEPTARPPAAAARYALPTTTDDGEAEDEPPRHEPARARRRVAPLPQPVVERAPRRPASHDEPLEPEWGSPLP